MLKQNQRALNRAMRDLDRERGRLESQEKKVIADIKKMAKQGQMVCKKLSLRPTMTAFLSTLVFSICTLSLFYIRLTLKMSSY